MDSRNAEFPKKLWKKHWEEILDVISKVEARNENLVIIGDANRLIGDVIPGNDPKVSYGGKMIRSLLESDNYVLVNAINKVKGGPEPESILPTLNINLH